MAVSLPQLTQALFIQKNQTLQNRFLISVVVVVVVSIFHTFMNDINNHNIYAY